MLYFLPRGKWARTGSDVQPAPQEAERMGESVLGQTEAQSNPTGSLVGVAGDV